MGREGGVHGAACCVAHHAAGFSAANTGDGVFGASTIEILEWVVGLLYSGIGGDMRGIALLSVGIVSRLTVGGHGITP